MIFDTHMHTKFSTDSKMKLQEAIAQARALAMGIIITEHMDFEYPLSSWFNLDVKGYLAEYSSYRSDTVLLGIEIGIMPHSTEQNRTLIQQYDLDYVIGSVHVVDNIDIYSEEFYRNRTQREVYSRYFSVMLECLQQYDFIDSLGHIDYIARYARYPDAEIYYEEYQELIDEILATVVRQQKVLEINTRRLNHVSAVQALLAIYRRYYELGGRYVTLGSDAHVPQDIGKNFAEALHIASSCQLKPVYFKNRTMEYIKI